MVKRPFRSGERKSFDREDNRGYKALQRSPGVAITVLRRDCPPWPCLLLTAEANRRKRPSFENSEFSPAGGSLDARQPGFLPFNGGLGFSNVALR
jgi:hypothetical protein